jgi:hypothetical protein
LFQVLEETATSGFLILKLVKSVELMLINKIQYWFVVYTPHLGRAPGEDGGGRVVSIMNMDNDQEGRKEVPQ